MKSKFKPLMLDYASKHGDRRNILIHYISVPVIIFGAFAILSSVQFQIAGFIFTPSMLLFTWIFISLLIADLRSGLVLGVILAVELYLAIALAAWQPIIVAIAAFALIMAMLRLQKYGHTRERLQASFSSGGEMAMRLGREQVFLSPLFLISRLWHPELRRSQAS